jgi:hypothetical protein
MTKVIVRIQLERDTMKALEEIIERRGMTQISAMSRLVKWMGRQDADIQRAILTDGGVNHAAASKILNQLAKRGGPKKKG